MDFQIAGKCQKELVLQELPIAQSLINTRRYRYTKDSQSETNEVILAIISAEQAFWQITILPKVHNPFQNTDLLITQHCKCK